MSGVVHNILTKRAFTFSNLQANTSQTIVLVRAIDVTDAKSIDLVVRVHQSVLGNGASLSIKAYQVSLTAEDPSTDFVGGVVATAPMMTNGTEANVLKVFPLTTPFGSMLRITIEAQQPVAGAVGITATLGADLVIRDN